MKISTLFAAAAVAAVAILPSLGSAQVYHRRGRTVVVRRGPVRVYRPHRRAYVRPRYIRRVRPSRVIVVPAHRRHHRY